MASYMIEFLAKDGDEIVLGWQSMDGEEASCLVKYYKTQGYIYDLFVYEGGVHWSRIGTDETEVCFD